jgi:hypothetical protein
MTAPGGSAPALTAPAPADSQPSFLQPAIIVPVLAILGYVAFVITGFGTGLGQYQPVPIYLYLSILLFLLQIILRHDQSFASGLYSFAAALFGIVYAAGAIFAKNSFFDLTKSGPTYITLNALAVIVFIIDAVRRHMAGELPGSTGEVQHANVSFRFYRILATDFAGLAILLVISSLLLDGVRTAFGYSVNLNAILGISALPGTIQDLDGLDLALAFVAAAVWLLLIVIIGALAGTGSQNSVGGNQSPFSSFASALGNVARRGFLDATFSLRSVLQIYLWLVPAFSIAIFSQQATTFLNSSASGVPTDLRIVELFNPLSPNSQSNFGNGLIEIALGLVALVAVVVTVAIADFNRQVIIDTVKQVGTFGRIVSLTLIFFSLSLAFTNAALILFNIDTSTPFQVGAVAVVGLIAFGVSALISALQPGPRDTATTS